MGGVAWTEEEDYLLKKCIEQYGEGKWHRIPFLAGCRKSCRLRWLNYLRPNIKRGSFTEEEIELIVKLHKSLGNRWSQIAGRLPGRTANDVKNYWNCHLSKRLNTQENNNNNDYTSSATSVGPPPCKEELNFQPPPTPTPEECIQSAPKFLSPNEAERGQVVMKEDQSRSGYENPGNDGGKMIEEEEEEEEEEEDDGSFISKWNWDDLVFDMDIWIDSL